MLARSIRSSVGRLAARLLGFSALRLRKAEHFFPRGKFYPQVVLRFSSLMALLLLLLMLALFVRGSVKHKSIALEKNRPIAVRSPSRLQLSETRSRLHIAKTSLTARAQTTRSPQCPIEPQSARFGAAHGYVICCVTQ